MVTTRSRQELMEGLAILLPSPKTAKRGTDDEVPKAAPHLLPTIQEEWKILRTWFTQHALGICAATGSLVSECSGCKESLDNGRPSGPTRSLGELGDYLRKSRFWYQIRNRTGPHQQEFSEAMLAILLSIHLLSGVAG